MGISADYRTAGPLQAEIGRHQGLNSFLHFIFKRAHIRQGPRFLCVIARKRTHWMHSKTLTVFFPCTFITQLQGVPGSYFDFFFLIFVQTLLEGFVSMNIAVQSEASNCYNINVFPHIYILYDRRCFVQIYAVSSIQACTCCMAVRPRQ